MQYSLTYSTSNNIVTWVKDFSLSVLLVGFNGVIFTLFAGRNTLPWLYDSPQVGFSKIQEEYFE